MSGLFVLAAGGTGGHLFPAQALAGELIRRGRRVIIMTDGRGHGYGDAFPGAEIATVPAATFAGRSIPGRIAALFVIAMGVGSAWVKLMRSNPRVVVGFGGYPSLPVMIAAWFARVPSMLHESNAVLGRVNRLVAPMTKAIAAALPFAKFAPKESSRVVFTGNPVRAEAQALKASPFVPPTQDGPINILIFGGSQGAKALSEIVPDALALLPENLRARLRVTQQGREADLPPVIATYAKAGITADVRKFFTNLPQLMGAAHLVIARSGASTIAEITVIGRPAIFIPYPHAMDDHQAANAAVLEKAGAAWVVAQDTLNSEKLSHMIADIFAHPETLQDRARAAAALGRSDAAMRLADMVEELGGAS